MDVVLAKTFLAIAETGSFKAAAERLFVTQSAISMRVKALEEALGRRLFVRSKSGAELTPAGDQFQRHAVALLRVWQHAQLEVSLSEHHVDHLAIGAEISLWEAFLLDWVGWLRSARKTMAVTATYGTSQTLIERLLEGTVDIAIAYRATARPGITVEHLMDDELILVSSDAKATKVSDRTYVFVNWGPEFTADHADTFPQLSKTGLHLDLGAVGVNYLLSYKASGYFPRRIVQPHLDQGRLVMVKQTRRIVFPVYVAYPEERNVDMFDPILKRLRQHAKKVGHV